MSQRQLVGRAVAWSGAGVILRQSLQFGVGIALARLLTPSDFGLMGMLLLFTSLGSLLVDSGFASALIQRRNHTEADASTVFWFNMAAGTVLAIALALAAPAIAKFFDESILVPLTLAMALNLWLASWLPVHSALLTKKLDFRTQMAANGWALIVASAAAIFLAFRDFGVWALAAYALITSGLNSLLLWRLHRWRPTFTFSSTSFRRLFAFGGFMFASAIIDRIGTQLYSIVIGKQYSSSDLGLYARAVTTRNFSQNILSETYSRVAFPLFSQQSDNPTALREGLRTANAIVMSINLPIMFGIAVTSELLVPAVFGEHWSATAPLLSILCLGGALWPLQVGNLQVLVAQGHSRLMLRLEVFKKALLASAVLIASLWSVNAIAWATTLSAVAAFFINAHYTRRLIGYTALMQLRDLFAYFLLASAMALIVAVTGESLYWLTPNKLLAIEVIVGASFYLSGAALLRLPALLMVIAIGRDLINNKQPPPST